MPWTSDSSSVGSDGAQCLATRMIVARLGLCAEIQRTWPSVSLLYGAFVWIRLGSIGCISVWQPEQGNAALLNMGALIDWLSQPVDSCDRRIFSLYEANEAVARRSVCLKPLGRVSHER